MDILRRRDRIISPLYANKKLPRLVKRLHHRDFFFVNIGANDGRTGDPVYPFLETYKWRGLAVEPLPYICDQLRHNYLRFKGVAIEQAAITPTPRPLFFIPPTATDAGFVEQIGSLHREYIEKTIALFRRYEFQGPIADTLEDAVQQIDVPCLTFEELLAKHAVEHIDFLNIDAEDSDYDILMMIDFTRWLPSILCIERSEFDETQKHAVADILRRAGYVYLEDFGAFSDVYVQARYARHA